MTNRTILFPDPPGSTTYRYVDVPTGPLNKEMMDMAFVKLVDSFNFPGGLGALLRDHRFDESGVNLGDHWKHKYLVDVDGMGERRDEGRKAVAGLCTEIEHGRSHVVLQLGAESRICRDRGVGFELAE